MGSYKVTFKRSVEKDLRGIDKSQIPKIISAIEKLEVDPFPSASRQLVGSNKTYRLRIGDYRAVYIVDLEVGLIEVQKISHRKEVYR